MKSMYSFITISFGWDHTCYCVNMVSVTSASCNITSASNYHPCYQRSSMYIRGLNPRKIAELAESVPIVWLYLPKYVELSLFSSWYLASNRNSPLALGVSDFIT